MESALSSYLPTLGRYAAVAVGVLIAIYIFYRVQVMLGIKREAATGRALVLPWVIGFLIFNLFPIGTSLYLSLTDFSLFDSLSDQKTLSTQNYKDIFTLNGAWLENPDQRSREVLPRQYKEVWGITLLGKRYIIGAKEEDFWISMKFTVTYAVMTIPLGLMGSLAVAMLLNQKVKGLSFWRVLFYAPAIIPVVTTALLWRWMFAQNGIINTLLGPIYDIANMDIPRWFTDPKMARPAFLIISLWGVFGANSVILLAGLKGVPQELYEAAALDGAGELRKFRHITLPMLSPSLFYVLVVSTIAALQVFDLAAFIPTSDEVGTFINWRIYREAFEFRDMGRASAMAWIVMIIILMLTLLIFRSSQAWVFYQGEREENK